MNRYKKGTRFERYFKREMEKNGYYAFRTAGSHSPADIILIPNIDGINKGFVNTVICQLKSYQGTKPKASDDFIQMEVPEFTVKWWVTKKDREPFEIEVFI